MRGDSPSGTCGRGVHKGRLHKTVSDQVRPGHWMLLLTCHMLWLAGCLLWLARLQETVSLFPTPSQFSPSGSPSLETKGTRARMLLNFFFIRLPSPPPPPSSTPPLSPPLPPLSTPPPSPPPPPPLFLTWMVRIGILPPNLLHLSLLFSLTSSLTV